MMMKEFLTPKPNSINHLLFFLFLGMGLAFTSVVQAISYSTTPKTSEAGTAQSLTIGGFDVTRGEYASIPDGFAFAEARQAITITYPTATFTSFPTITQSALVNTDIVILTATSDGSNPITPLSAAEQTALADFVNGGGCAILLADNSDFAAANESLIDPFSMDIMGMIWGWRTVSVTSPTTSPLTNGFHGMVTSFTQGWSGGLTDLGPYATSYASNSLGDALAVIEPDVIAQESGAVIVYTDATSFIDVAEGGGFGDNETLFLNSIAFCQQQIVYLPLIMKE
jgi:hypothetical protein